VINLRDGSVWERRAVTAAGVALYALAGSCKCPEYLMASESELAAQGIAGTADVLPVPVGPEPLALSVERLNEIAARADAATAGPWCTDSWEIYQGTEYQPGISQWIGETCRGTSSPEQDRADAEFVAAARADVPALVAEVRRLLAERHSTNESLDTAVQELRTRRDETTAAPYEATPETHAQMRAALTKHYATARNGACENCGSVPEEWCPDCAACEQGCFGGFDGNSCSHSKAKWGGGS